MRFLRQINIAWTFCLIFACGSSNSSLVRASSRHLPRPQGTWEFEPQHVAWRTLQTNGFPVFSFEKKIWRKKRQVLQHCWEIHNVRSCQSIYPTWCRIYFQGVPWNNVKWKNLSCRTSGPPPVDLRFWLDLPTFLSIWFFIGLDGLDGLVVASTYVAWSWANNDCVPQAASRRSEFGKCADPARFRSREGLKIPFAGWGGWRANYNDLSRGHLKWWFLVRGIPPVSP